PHRACRQLRRRALLLQRRGAAAAARYRAADAPAALGRRRPPLRRPCAIGRGGTAAEPHGSAAIAPPPAWPAFAAPAWRRAGPARPGLTDSQERVRPRADAFLRSSSEAYSVDTA